MRTRIAHPVPFALGLALALAAAVAPAAAQETRPASPGAVVPPAPGAATTPGTIELPGTRLPLRMLRPGAAPLTDRERLLISLLPAGCEGGLGFDAVSSGVCPDRFTDGKGISCDTRDKALDDLVGDLNRRCKTKCEAVPCGRNDKCGFFGQDYKKDVQDCREVTAPNCPDDKRGFVCQTIDVTCTCICGNP